MVCGGRWGVLPLLKQLGMCSGQVQTTVHQRATGQRDVQRKLHQPPAKHHGLLLDAVRQQLCKRLRLGLQYWLLQGCCHGQLHCMQNCVPSRPIHLLLVYCHQPVVPSGPCMFGMHARNQCPFHWARDSGERCILSFCVQFWLLPTAQHAAVRGLDVHLCAGLVLEQWYGHIRRDLHRVPLPQSARHLRLHTEHVHLFMWGGVPERGGPSRLSGLRARHLQN